MVVSSGDFLTVHNIADKKMYGRFLLGIDGENGTLRHIEIHLPHSGPLVERVQVFVETYVVLWHQYLSIHNYVACEESHLRVNSFEYVVYI